MANAEGLKECRQLLKLATLGKYPGYLLEGMACPGGCVAGAGTSGRSVCQESKPSVLERNRIHQRTG